MASLIVHHLSSQSLQCPVIYLPIVTSSENLILRVFRQLLAYFCELKTFPDSRQVNVGIILLIDASQVHFQRILSRCKWCCVIIVDLTSFFPSKEFLLVLESFKIAMKASSWKLTKIIKGSIISPLSASLGWNCVNLLVFCTGGVMAMDVIKICDTWPHVEASYWPHASCQAPHWPVPRAAVTPVPGMDGPDTMTRGTWHSASQTCHNTSRSATWYKYDMLLMWLIIECRGTIISCESEISSAGYIRVLHYEWSKIRDWMEIMKVMRLWDAYPHDLIGLQSANQRPELWSSDDQWANDKVGLFVLIIISDRTKWFKLHPEMVKLYFFWDSIMTQ